jgi:hypothetical protein
MKAVTRVEHSLDHCNPTDVFLFPWNSPCGIHARHSFFFAITRSQYLAYGTAYSNGMFAWLNVEGMTT